MGNVQASSIANQLLPFESYIVDVPELKYLHSLGSTRFMKVARAEHAEGPMVIKVFVPADQSFSVEPYRDQVFQIRRRLLNHPNSCPFTRVYITNRCAILCRPYWKFTLYDRLSTRPFLLPVEKRWIAFQLLKALAQCRIAMVRHGDIKSQNILVSSCLWVQLTDFASFKPTFLPSDDPSDFTFFFDTSRRRYCYLAPERFKKGEELSYSGRLPGDFVNISEGLTEAMDIFSMGCVFVELFSDGRQVAFHLPQAIDYKRMDDHPAGIYIQKILSTVPEGFRELIAVMLDRNPTRRRDEFSKMSPCSSSQLFPPIFEKYLYRYFKEFQMPTAPDDVITKLYVERDNYFAEIENDPSESVVLFINLVLSMIRGCRSLTSKMDSISLLNQLSKLASPSVVLDRIVPYLCVLFMDSFPQVRSEAIFVVTEILSTIESIPRDECRLLIDFIFTKLKPVISDSSKLVKMTLASNLGQLAVISLRFFNEGATWLRYNEEDSFTNRQSPSPNNDATSDQQQSDGLTDEERLLMRVERQALLETVSELFVNLCGSENEVRKCIFEPKNLDLLCQFFGPNRATDILMHMITLLNDKPDWRMRATFFHSCPVVAGHIGQNRNGKLKPFLQQGLQDCEEFVVHQTLQCIYSLCDQQLLSKATICEILEDLVPFLVHPNKWLRVAVVNILVVLDSLFSVSDIFCKLSPLVKPYLREQLIRFNDKDVVYECLGEPIGRQIWDFILIDFPEYVHSADLISALENRRTLEKLGGGRNSLFSAISTSAPPSSVASLTSLATESGSTEDCGSGGRHMQVDTAIRKLQNMGLNGEEVEDKLLAFKNVLLKMDNFRKTLSPQTKYLEVARISLDTMPKVHRRVFDLERGVHKYNGLDGKSCFAIDQLQISKSSSDDVAASSTDRHINQSGINGSSAARILLEATLQHKQMRYRDQKRITTSSGEKNSEIYARATAAAAAQNGIEGGEGKKGPALACGLLDREQDHGADMQRSGRRRPNLRLLAHMHEHSEKITKLAMHPDRDHFASSSADKSVKIWCSSTLQNHQAQPAALSKDTLRYSHPITSCGFMGHSGGHLVMACGDASLQVFDINQKHLLKSHQFDRDKDGAVTDLYCCEHLIYALTHHSAIFCFDLRMTPKNSRNSIELATVWRRFARNSYGLMTSFSVDQSNQQWMLLTASSATTKNMILCDLRFGGQEVSSWSHPSDRIIPLNSWPLVQGSRCQKVFTSCSREAEVSLWDLPTQSVTDVLWPSSETPLTYKNEWVTTALSTSAVDHDVVFTGDSEGSLRCWNLRSVDRSSYLCGPYRRHLIASPTTANDIQELERSLPLINYRQVRLKDSVTRVQVEDRSKLGAAEYRDVSRTLRVPEYHTDAITDLATFWPDLLVSSGRDGTVKMWKLC